MNNLAFPAFKPAGFAEIKLLNKCHGHQKPILIWCASSTSQIKIKLSGPRAKNTDAEGWHDLSISREALPGATLINPITIGPFIKFSLSQLLRDSPASLVEYPSWNCERAFRLSSIPIFSTIAQREKLCSQRPKDDKEERKEIAVKLNLKI